MTVFRLAHLSDPHLPPPPGSLRLADLASKRAVSALAWRRKGRAHQPAVLAALVADIAAWAPDHIALTGDLTNFAAPAEVAAARAWLQRLGPASSLTLSPGNHDALVGESDARRFSAWADWLGDDWHGTFPQVRLRQAQDVGVALINACSAVPTPLASAQGRLGEAQLERLEAQLAGLAGRPELFRMLLLHHPPAAGVVSRRKSLIDGQALRAVIARHGVHLVLHGHGHEAAVSSLPGLGGPIPVLGVPSASAAGGGHHPAARWHGFEIAREGDGATVRVQARGLGRAGVVEALGAYDLAVPHF